MNNDKSVLSVISRDQFDASRFRCSHASWLTLEQVGKMGRESDEATKAIKNLRDSAELLAMNALTGDGWLKEYADKVRVAIERFDSL